MAGNRAQWMAEGSYGVMIHYLVGPEGQTPEEKTASLNKTIDEFNLDAFMAQFAASKADWLIFTLGQNTAYYNSPNDYLDKLLPGHTPRRDLALEIARRVKNLGKRFIAYVPAEVAGVPELHPFFAWSADDKTVFHERYLAFLRVYAERLGPLCDGWWVDGCYDSPPFNARTYPWDRWAEALRAGNPARALAFNDGGFCVGRLAPVTPLQDYLSGEVHILEDAKIRTDCISKPAVARSDGLIRMPGQEMATYCMPTGQFSGGVQVHALVPLYLTFSQNIPSEMLTYPDEMLFRFIREFKAVKGAVTLNVPVDRRGVILPVAARQLERVGGYVSKLGPTAPPEK